MPFGFLQDHLGFLSALRDPSRFFLLSHLALTLAGAMGWQHLRRGGRGVGLAVLLFAGVDLAPGLADRIRIDPPPEDREVLDWLADRAAPAVWTFYPLPCEERMESLIDARATLWASLRGIPTIGGSAGFVPPAVRDLRRACCGQGLDQVIPLLAERGVQWVIVPRPSMEEGAAPALKVAYSNRSWEVYSMPEDAP